jgi:hypothetical protein
MLEAVGAPEVKLAELEKLKFSVERVHTQWEDGSWGMWSSPIHIPPTQCFELGSSGCSMRTFCPKQGTVVPWDQQEAMPVF